MLKHTRNVFLYCITGFILAFCYVSGFFLEKNDTIDFTNKNFYLLIFLLSVVFSFIIFLLWKMLYKINTFQDKKNSKIYKFFKSIDIHLPIWGYMLIILVCWMPTWLAIFPGAFTYDAYDEWQQVCLGNLTAHHPVLHVLLLGGLTEGIYQLTGSYNLGIAIYTFIQMLFVSWVFAYTLAFLRKQQICGLLRLLALIFYCLSPVIALFTVCATKDIIFSAGALWFMVMILQLLQNPEQFLKSKQSVIFFLLAAIVTMIFRNNGLYIVVLTLGIIGIYLKKHFKSYIKIALLIMALYVCLSPGVNKLLNVTPGGIEEMLSVPIQQLARVHHYEKESFSQEELDLLYSILPEENLNAYRISVADFVKSGFIEEAFESKKVEFFRLWIKTGLNHPFTYVNSFLLGTVDFWYPHAIMDGYRDVYGRSSYCDYKVSEPGTEMVLLPAVHEFYEYISWDKEAQTIPGIFLLLSPGWYFVMFFVVFMYLWKQRHYDKMIAMGVIVINMLTVLLGPIALVRYVLILFYAFPLLFHFIQHRK